MYTNTNKMKTPTESPTPAIGIVPQKRTQAFPKISCIKFIWDNGNYTDSKCRYPTDPITTNKYYPNKQKA
jgi:hypothetical protein